MTTKIDDEMIERACRAMGHAFPHPDAHARAYVRGVLEAALNHPEEPDIPVSEGMLKAASGAAGLSWPGDITCTLIFRAMEKARRKEEQRNPEWVTTKTECVSPGVTRITGYFR